RAQRKWTGSGGRWRIWAKTATRVQGLRRGGLRNFGPPPVGAKKMPGRGRILRKMAEPFPPPSAERGRKTCSPFAAGAPGAGGGRVGAVGGAVGEAAAGPIPRTQKVRRSFG